jgi:transcriptional regulator with XRE-family HTH domain
MVQMDKVREEFAQRLALACKEAGLDDHGRGMSIARALNVSAKAASKWLNGESIPRQDKLNQLANFLHADPICYNTEPIQKVPMWNMPDR